MTHSAQPVDTPPVAATRPRKQDRTTLALLMVAALIAIGGVGFAIGRTTAPAAASTGNGNNNFGGFGRGNFPTLAPGQTFNPGQFGGNFRGAGGGISGTVVSIDATGITLKLTDGSTVKVLLTGATTFHSETAAASSDVVAGATVRIQVATGASAGSSPAPSASGQTGQRTITAGDVLITNP